MAMRTAARWGETCPHVIDELVQETYLKLYAKRCRILRDFQPRHADAVYGYLKVVTANIVHDHFKSQRSVRCPQAAIPPNEASGMTAPHKHIGSAETIERHILLNEVDDLLQSCVTGPTQQRDRMIFWLYYRQGLSARAIAALPAVGLSDKGVESTILRLTRLLRSGMSARRTGEAAARCLAGPKGNRVGRLVIDKV
jgi:RNA polymerase sigma-70 factor, ECF subfamily